MQKISLKNLNLQEVERLTREQLKGIIGGDDEVIGVIDSCPTNCFRTSGGNTAAGTCTQKSDNIDGVISKRCECSLAGASC